MNLKKYENGNGDDRGEKGMALEMKSAVIDARDKNKKWKWGRIIDMEERKEQGKSWNGHGKEGMDMKGRSGQIEG